MAKRIITLALISVLTVCFFCVHRSRGTKRIIVLALIIVALMMAAIKLTDAQTREYYVGSFNVGMHQTYDTKEILFIELRNSRGSILISGDRDVEVIKELAKFKKVIITIEDGSVGR